MKILKDTLKTNGKWSQKRLQTFACFYATIIYIFVPLFRPEFEVKEFVVASLLALGGFTIFRTQKTNENENINQNQEQYNNGR